MKLTVVGAAFVLVVALLALFLIGNLLKANDAIARTPNA